MEPADILQEFFEEAIPAAPRESQLKRSQRAAIARTQTRLALDRLHQLGFTIVRPTLPAEEQSETPC